MAVSEAASTGLSPDRMLFAECILDKSTVLEVEAELELEECIVLTRSPGESGWSSHHIETGVASQGETREESLEMLDEAVALHRGEIGEPVTDDDLREWGIDPDEIPDEPEIPPWLEDEPE